MLKIIPRWRQEQCAGLLFVIALHGAAWYGLWSYHIIPTPDEAITLMVDLINPTPHVQPESPVPEPSKPAKTIAPPTPQPRVAETPVVMPDEPVAPAPPPAPIVVTPPLPPQPVLLSGELSVSCPERSPPDYPALSRRMNEQGKVVLRVELDVEGQITNVTVSTHSGHPRLDEAAVHAVKSWRCKPALRNGTAVVAVALQPFIFSLEGR